MTVQQVPIADAALEGRLQDVLSVHLDPKWGSPFWLDRVKRLPFDPRREIRSVHDLPRLGLTDPDELTRRPLDDFIPRSVQSDRAKLIVAQTGGTLGQPAWTAYDRDEFDQAFVGPFVAAARHVGFPSGGNWLYAGPSGPHIIGRAAGAIARRTGSASPFTVDFDPRWAKKLPAGSYAAARYLRHVVEQSLAIVRTQQVDLLFTTPLVLKSLADGMSREERERIRGIHYGGMALSPEELCEFQLHAFPGAVHLAGYGNTLFGCCLELSVEPRRTLRYFPAGNRLALGIARQDGDAESRLHIAYDRESAEGRLVFTRLDRTMLLVNVLERDRVRLVAPPADAPHGFVSTGVESPTPAVQTTSRAAVGLY